MQADNCLELSTMVFIVANCSDLSFKIHSLSVIWMRRQ